MIKRSSALKKKTSKWFFPLTAMISFLVSIAGIFLVFRPDLVRKMKEKTKEWSKEWSQGLKD